MEPWEELPDDVPQGYRLIAIALILATLIFMPGCTHFGNKRTQFENDQFRGACAIQPIGSEGNVLYAYIVCNPVE